MDKARIQAELQRIGRNIAEILQENFVGFYITGSFAMGVWNPQSSDLDFLVVVKHPVKPGEDAALQKLHTELAKSDFGKRLEGEYIDLRTLRQKNFHTLIGTVLDGEYFPHYPCQLSADNLLCLIQYGQCIDGEPVERLSLQVTTQELNEAVYEILMEDSEELASATDFKKVVYLLIDSLRCIYTLRTGQLPTKQIAIAFNRDLLSSGLYTNLTKFQQGLLPHFEVPKVEVRAILDYGLSLKHSSKS